jgi:uncharacterized membrane protein YdjX (TVP38/TMEM64 family)
MQFVTGYIFGTAWWGFALNLIAYFIAAHVRLASCRMWIQSLFQIQLLQKSL